MIKFTVMGEPVAQGRPRACRRGGGVGMYDPGKSKDYKRIVAAEARRSIGCEPLVGQLKIALRVFRPLPKSFSAKKKKLGLDGKLRPITKPDGSNYLKGVEDALNGIVYKDDSQLVTSVVEKYYGNPPRVEVEITEV